jgi:hypothetical protein
MKTLFVSLTAFLFAFLIGCQSSITDPVGTDNGYSANKDFISTLTEMIKVDDAVLDPTHPLGNPTKVKGFIRYNLQQIQADLTLTPPPPQLRVKLSAYIDLTLTPDCPRVKVNNNMKVVASIDKTVFFTGSNDAAIFFNNVFRVRNCCCGPMDMILKFQVDRKELKLVSMELIAIEQ